MTPCAAAKSAALVSASVPPRLVPTVPPSPDASATRSVGGNREKSVFAFLNSLLTAIWNSS
jgi:hypothetical protein